VESIVLCEIPKLRKFVAKYVLKIESQCNNFDLQMALWAVGIAGVALVARIY
jgi:hypothetical protein